MGTGITIASHNTMHGVFLDELIARYEWLVAEHRVDVLCLQENVPISAPSGDAAHRTHADLVAYKLPGFQCVCLDDHHGLATLVHPDWVVEEAFLVALPLLEGLNWFERLYIRGGKVTEKFALVTRVRRHESHLTVVNFHLETAGTNQHRQRQVQAVASALTERGITCHVAACGDTNAFSWSRQSGKHAVAELMKPLRSLGGAAPKTNGEPTHFFARQREALLPHRLACAIGRFGIDHPLPYDVICSDLHAATSGIITTEESDHDLVYAELHWP